MEFKPRRSNKTGRELLVLGGAFLIFSAGVFFLADKTAGFALAGVSILLLAVIVFETGRFGWSYSVDDEGIEIKRTFRRYFIAKDNIESVKEISREQAFRKIYDGKQYILTPADTKAFLQECRKMKAR